MTLEQFNQQYKYKTDKQKFGFIEVWDIPKLQEDGFYYGDCESYCLFLKNNIEQFKGWDLYFCKINGNGHCILYKKGDVIDCNTQKIVNFEQYCKLFKVTNFKKFNKFTIMCKFIMGKIIKVIKGVFMPLKKGSSQKTISANIRAERKAGVPRVSQRNEDS